MARSRNGQLCQHYFALGRIFHFANIRSNMSKDMRPPRSGSLRPSGQPGQRRLQWVEGYCHQFNRSFHKFAISSPFA